MIIEVLLLGPGPKLPVQPSSLSIDWEYTAVEENVIYYTAGYVLRKLMKKYRGSDKGKLVKPVVARTVVYNTWVKRLVANFWRRQGLF